MRLQIKHLQNAKITTNKNTWPHLPKYNLPAAFALASSRTVWRACGAHQNTWYKTILLVLLNTGRNF
jgi:hypothetical protein